MALGSLPSFGSERGVPSNRFSPKDRLTTLAAVVVRSNFSPLDLIFIIAIMDLVHTALGVAVSQALK